MAETVRRVRTPEQIIGADALLQLVFEGYEVIPLNETITAQARRLAADANVIFDELEQHGDDGENQATYRRMARAQLIRPWHDPARRAHPTPSKDTNE